MALKYISRKACTEKELRDYLTKKHNISDNEKEEIINFIKNNGYIDDEYFKLVYIQAKVSKGYGSKYISRKLKQKGIPLDSEEEKKIEIDLNRIREIIIRRYGDKLKKAKREEKLKLVRNIKNFLSYRGFKPSEIKEILNSVFNNT